MTWPKITLETPMEELKRIHQDIWQYVVENGEKPETPYTCNCVGCEWSYVKGALCAFCPIDWKDLGAQVCFLKPSVYNLWEKETDPDRKRHLAELIRDVKWKFEKEE